MQIYAYIPQPYANALVVLVPPLVTTIVTCYLQSLNWMNFKVVFLRPFGKEMTKRKREETQIVSQERKS